jgi:hypothetical protein
LTALSAAACGADHLFRSVDIGMTRDQVEKAEKKSEYVGEADDQVVYYVDSVYGYKQEDIKVVYGFDSDKLTEITVLITIESSSELDEAYETIKASMIEKFGSDYTTTSAWLKWTTDDSIIGLTKWQDDVLAIAISETK